MPKFDFLFVDTSGDEGDGIETGSSKYYAAALLHITDEDMAVLYRHIISFRYVTGKVKELKMPVGTPDYSRYMERIGRLASEQHFWLTCVYLRKDAYTGPYLHSSSRGGKNPSRFRNFILRQLLECHFASQKVRSQQLELVLDRFSMTVDETEDLRKYLQGNYRLPSFTYITHADSRYVELLEVPHHIASAFKEIALGRATAELSSMASSVRAKDIANP